MLVDIIPTYGPVNKPISAVLGLLSTFMYDQISIFGLHSNTYIYVTTSYGQCDTRSSKLITKYSVNIPLKDMPKIIYRKELQINRNAFH